MSEPQHPDNARLWKDTPSSRSLEQAREALMYDEGTFDSVVRNVALALDAARAEVLERFEEKYIPEPNSGCWLWIAATDGKYGQISVDGRLFKAHRWYYELVNGAIGSLDLDHKCRNTFCVNPLHLEPVTRSENALRGARAGTYGRAKKSKTHCPKGHPYEGDNLRIQVRGNSVSRHCRECERARFRPGP